MTDDKYPEFSNPMQRPRYVGIPTFFVKFETSQPWSE